MYVVQHPLQIPKFDQKEEKAKVVKEPHQGHPAEVKEANLEKAKAREMLQVPERRDKIKMAKAKAQATKPVADLKARKRVPRHRNQQPHDAWKCQI